MYSSKGKTKKFLPRFCCYFTKKERPNWTFYKKKQYVVEFFYTYAISAQWQKVAIF